MIELVSGVGIFSGLILVALSWILYDFSSTKSEVRAAISVAAIGLLLATVSLGISILGE